MRKEEFPRGTAAVFVGLLLAVLAGGVWVSDVRRREILSEAHQDLRAVASFKVSRVAEWYVERLDDAASIMGSPYSRRALVGWITAGNGDADDDLSDRLALWRETQYCSTVYVVGAAGGVLTTVGSSTAQLHEAALDAVERAAGLRRPVMIRLHRSADDGSSVHVGVVAPLFDETRPGAPFVGAAILVSDAQRFVFPIMRSWPTRTASAEAFLVRREGAEAIFVTGVRHRDDGALTLRLPLTRADSPAVMAVRGRRGAVTARDYRGVDVLAHLSEVPGTPWLAVVKMDVDEILAPWRRESAMIVALLLMLTAAGGATVLAVWQRREKRQYRALVRAEEALRERERLLSDVVDGSPIATFVLDAEHRVRFWNRALADLSEVPPEDIVGTRDHWKPFYDEPRPVMADMILDGADEPAIASRYGDKLSRSVLPGAYEAVDFFPRLGGMGRWLHFMACPLRAEDGTLLGAIETLQDMTERRRLEEQLRQSQKMEAVGQLAGGVAHDFNNMLAVILGQVDLAIRQIEADDPMRGRLERIRTAAQRSANLTRQLLGFARRQTIRPEKLDLNAAVESIMDMLGRLIGEHVVLEWRPDPDLWPVELDSNQLDQILTNLVVNARDAVGSTGTVVIGTENIVLDEAAAAVRPGASPGDFAALTVRDDGCGMGEDVCARVFEPFFTTKEAGRGTGLGLSTVYGIVKQNDGYIEIDSAPGDGTVVTVYLPRFHDEGVAPPKKPTLGAERDRGGGGTILLVEDEPTVLEIVEDLLADRGYSVMTASSPVEALRLAGEADSTFSLLLTDVVMPEMDGRELYERLKRLHPGLGCVFMSGYTSDVLSRYRVAQTDVHFVQKPFRGRELLDVVREALEARVGD